MNTIICANDTGYDYELFKTILYELRDLPVSIIYQNIKMPDKVKKMAFSARLNKLFPNLNKYVVKHSRYLVEEFLNENNKESFRIIFFNVAMKYYDRDYLIKLKNKYQGVQFDLCFIDSHRMSSANKAYELLESNRDLFSNVYTVDGEDAAEWSIKKIYTPYSVDRELSRIADKPYEYCTYWCGTLKGREEILIPLISNIKKNNISYKLFVYTWGKKRTVVEEIGRLKTTRDGFLPYKQVLYRTLKANVVLDIVKEHFPLTLRTYEAVVYQKKLLSNNPEILNFKFYDNNYIRYFKNVDDIDYSWFFSEDIPNYQYENEFLPQNVLNIQ